MNTYKKLVRQDCSSYWEWKVYKKRNYNPIEWTRSKCCCVFYRPESEIDSVVKEIEGTNSQLDVLCAMCYTLFN